MNNFFNFFPFLFIGSWVLISFIISKMGWSNLVSKYKFDNNFIGNNIGMISASINNASYRNSIILKYNNEGIYFKTLFLFRLFHAPFFIPWEEIKNIKNKQFFFTSLVELSIGSPVIAKIKISQSTYSKFEKIYIINNLGKT